MLLKREELRSTGIEEGVAFPHGRVPGIEQLHACFGRCRTGVDFDSFDGWTVAEIAQAYGESAGGAGFDIGRFGLSVDPETGCKWIQYVRVEDNPDSSATTEIDGFADVIPEPATMVMLALGGLAILRRRSR